MGTQAQSQLKLTNTAWDYLKTIVCTQHTQRDFVIGHLMFPLDTGNALIHLCSKAESDEKSSTRGPKLTTINRNIMSCGIVNPFLEKKLDVMSAIHNITRSLSPRKVGSKFWVKRSRQWEATTCCRAVAMGRTAAITAKFKPCQKMHENLNQLTDL